MNTLNARYDRNIRLFGEKGQRKLRETDVVLAGVGGLGSPIAQYFAQFGVRHVGLIDPEDIDDTNRNRFVGARHDDPVPGSPKVSLSARLIQVTNPDVAVTEIRAGLVSEGAFDAIKAADWVFGCFDRDGPRFILNELCAAYEKPYIDIAADVPEPGVYGGRVCISWDNNGCLNCFGLLDESDIREYLSPGAEKDALAAIYGVPCQDLGQVGPSVAPVNGVVAAMAALEFMVAVTDMREPTRLIDYQGHHSKAFVSKDAGKEDCYYCKAIRGTGREADVERYLKMEHLY